MSDNSSESGPGVNRLTETATSISTAGSQGTEHPLPAIPDHELLRLIGRGSYGEVWLARNALGSFRAVKVVYRQSFDHDRPYEREFNGLKKFEPISHARESQVDIFHVGRNDEAGFFYYIMELADDAAMAPPRREEDRESKMEDGRNIERGSDACHPPSSILHPHSYAPRTLKHDLRTRGALPVAECVQIALSLTRALEHLHAHGLVHRDIKPSNIIFVNGAPKLADIGLVTSVDATRSFVGTDGYIPPEGPGTPQADLYSLGKVLYECVTGKDRLDFPELPADWRTRPDFDQLLEFNEVLTKTCDAEPNQRYQAAEEMRGDLELLTAGMSVKLKRKRRQHWLVCKSVGFAVALIALAAIIGFRLTRDEADKYLKSSKPEVNNLVKQGHDLIRLEKPDQIWNAIAKFKQAIELDSNFAPAHNGLFHAYVHAQGNPEADKGILQEAKRLMILSPASAEAVGANAFVKWLDWHFQDALAEAGQAAKLRAISKEGEAYKYLEYGYFLQETGDSTNALRQYQLAHKLLPQDPIILDHLGQANMMRHDFEEAEKQLRNSIIQQPDHWNGHYYLVRLYENWRGHFGEAIRHSEIGERLRGVAEPEIKRRYEGLRDAVLQGGEKSYWQKKLEEAQKESPPKFYYLATLHAHLGKKEQAYALLEKACEQRDLDGPMYDLCWDHNDPKFRAILRGTGIIK